MKLVSKTRGEQKMQLLDEAEDALTLLVGALTAPMPDPTRCDELVKRLAYKANTAVNVTLGRKGQK